MVEILQLLHEISSFPEVLYEIGDLKNFSKLQLNKEAVSEGVLSKDVLKCFAEFTEKRLCWSLFFDKPAGWKPLTVRSSHWRWFFSNESAGWKPLTVRSSHWKCSVKKGVFKKAHWCFRTSRS